LKRLHLFVLILRDFIDTANLHPASENMHRARSIVLNLQAEVQRRLNASNNMSFELASRLQQWERELQVYFSPNLHWN